MENLNQESGFDKDHNKEVRRTKPFEDESWIQELLDDEFREERALFSDYLEVK